jgi:hypothetical protein
VRLAPEELEARKQQFEARTKEFKGLGYDRFLTPAFVLEGIEELAGPVLDLGTEWVSWRANWRGGASRSAA